MRTHLEPQVWAEIFRQIENSPARKEEVWRGLGISRAAFYKRYKEYREGEIKSRKHGSGRPPLYRSKEWLPRIERVLSEVPPVYGYRRIHRALQRQGKAPSACTVHRLLKAAGLIVPRISGKSLKRYTPVRAEKPDEKWLADTTQWPTTDGTVEIFMCMDVFSRRLIGVTVSLHRDGASSCGFFTHAFSERRPKLLITDGGSEFKTRDVQACLEHYNVLWECLPSYTPQARGLIERLVNTLKYEWLAWKEPGIHEIQQSLREFKDWYNKEREHSSLNWRTPEEVYNGKA